MSSNSPDIFRRLTPPPHICIQNCVARHGFTVGRGIWYAHRSAEEQESALPPHLFEDIVVIVRIHPHSVKSMLLAQPTLFAVAPRNAPTWTIDSRKLCAQERNNRKCAKSRRQFQRLQRTLWGTVKTMVLDLREAVQPRKSFKALVVDQRV